MLINEFQSDKRLFNPRKAIGKTINRVGSYRGDMLLVFTDDTFLHFRATVDQYEDTPTLNHDSIIRMYAAFSLGLLSQDDYNAWVRKQDEAEAAKQEQADRETYEALKAKYGKGD